MINNSDKQQFVKLIVILNNLASKIKAISSYVSFSFFALFPFIAIFSGITGFFTLKLFQKNGLDVKISDIYFAQQEAIVNVTCFNCIYVNVSLLKSDLIIFENTYFFNNTEISISLGKLEEG
mgnify:CR=1 FL=1